MIRHVDSQSIQAVATPVRTVAVICSYTASLVNFRYRLLAAMTAGGHRVIAFGPEHDPASVAALSAIEVEFHRVPMARAGLNPFADLRTLAHLWRVLRAHDPDVVLCYTMKPIIYGLIAARLAGIRRRYALVTGLGYVFSDSAASLRLRLIRRLATRLYRIALRGCRRVFVYNDADAHDIRAGRMVSGDTPIIMVAGSGVDLERFQPAPLPAGAPAFLLIARLLREKGIAEFAKAALDLHQRHPQARFRILGPLDPSPLAISRAEIDAWTASGAVEYLGETRDVRPFLRDASVFVLPSYYREGVPRSILEAMAMGRPIITADSPGCRETVINGENGFIVPPRDPTALAAAMERFIRDPMLARAMGKRALEVARTRFDVEAVNRHLLTEMDLLGTADGR
ncbi:glycosyltransferase family 4 protein [Rhodoligotrophos defluvii]|uniref:glycosyltransferase family 4 protein n=1 Tax=Rhodoligotrophos defluvii TaxID=2561934 RepID=UPI0010C99341|nr:glycosyltransferase family 4 protein [Rhodoligotrophos defluvii]